MQLVKPESASHFYQCIEGVWKPCYEVPKKDGNGMKRFTLREAKESNPPAVPSVTSILDIINKPGLQAWKQEQGILSSLTLPRSIEPFELWFAKRPNGIVDPKDLLRWAYQNRPCSLESEDVFCKRVIEDMDAQSEKAKDFGSQVHAAAEAFFVNQISPFLFEDTHAIDEAIKPYIEKFIEWAKDQVTTVIASELCCGCEECGYAGRLDLVCVLKDFGFSVVDLKSQKIKRDKKGIKQPAFYAEWPRQLAAYAHTFCLHSTGKAIPSMVSVIIDSSEPGPVYVKKWDNYQHHLKMFQHCLELWCDDRDYRPMKI